MTTACRVGLKAGEGAAVHANSSAIFLFNSSFNSNEAEATGGCAVSSTQGPVLVSACQFERNKCTPNPEQQHHLSNFVTTASCAAGGASLQVTDQFPSPYFGDDIDCEDIPADQIVAIFSTNFTADLPAGSGACGGSVRVQEAWLDVRGSHFASTNDCSKGAGIGAEYSTVSISDSSFKDLASTYDSGGVFAYRGRTWIARSSFRNCHAARATGGAVGAPDGTGLFVTSSRFRNCSAKTGGGCIFFQLVSEQPEQPPLFVLHNSSLVECRATREGGAFTADQVEVEVSGSVFDRCEVRDSVAEVKQKLWYHLMA